MTKLIVETNNEWTRKKIKASIDTEAEIFRNTIRRIRNKLNNFEEKYGKFDRGSLYGVVDDMILLEWEGELDTLKKIEEKLSSLEEITFEYR